MLNIRKKVYFHQISWINNGGENISKDSDFFSSIIKNIAPMEDKSEYKEIIGDLHSEGDWIFGVISKSKKTDFPLKQNFDDLSLKPLGLAENEGLYYPSHFAIYKGQILISELNIESFRVASFLGRKINQYLKNNDIYNTNKINIKPILREGIKETLQNSKFRSVQLDIASSNLDTLKSDNSLRKMFNTIETPPDVILKLGFSIGNKRSEKYYEEMDFFFFFFIYILDNYSVSLFEKMNVKIKNLNGDIEEINILDDIFKVEEDFIRINDNTKAINSADTFLKFRKLYEKNEKELDKYIDAYD